MQIFVVFSCGYNRINACNIIKLGVTVNQNCEKLSPFQNYMNWSKPSDCLSAIRAGDFVEQRRGNNRTKILQSLNGAPPLEDAEAKRLGLAINVNFGRHANLVSQAKRQYMNNFCSGARFYKITLPQAKPEKEAEWSDIITTTLNDILQDSKPFNNLQEYRWNDVVVHGVAAALWDTPEDWCPKFLARDDFRVPTDARTDCENLEWFCYRWPATVGELLDKVFLRKEEGWNIKAVSAILEGYKNTNVDQTFGSTDWWRRPEQMADILKQNLGLFTSDALPIIPIFLFYFKDVDKKWYRRAMPDTPAKAKSGEDIDEFLYTDENPFCENLQQLLNMQFGDLSFKAPYHIQAIRSVGFALQDACFYDNLTACRHMQHVHENFNIWLQINDPGDKARATSINFNGPVAKIPQSVAILNGNQRHQIDPRQVEMIQAYVQQSLAEKSSSYTQQIDNGTSKEQTAYETGVKVQQVNAQLSGLISKACKEEKFFAKEICRRFCIKTSSNYDVRDFQEKCKDQGVPEEWLNVARWRVDVETPLGFGNPVLGRASATQLLEIANQGQLSPTASQYARHTAFSVLFSAKDANILAPFGEQKVTNAQTQAESDFATCMWGVMPVIHEELNPQEQIELLLMNLQTVVNTALQTGGNPPQLSITGMQTVAGHMEKLIQNMSQDPEQKQRVTSYQKALAGMMNEVKAFQQRLQEQQQAQQDAQNQESQAKAQATMIKAQVDAHLKQAKFEADQQRKTQTTATDQHRKNVGTAMGEHRKNLETGAQIQRDNASTVAEISQSHAKAEAEREIAKKNAENKAELATEAQPA